MAAPIETAPGWSSNLLDRLGLHYLTAPGSIRGAVDFLHLGGTYYNLADLFIIAATPLFLLAVAALGRRATNRPATVGAVAAATPHPPRARAGMSAVVGAGLVVVVALGGAHDGGVTAPAHAGAKGDRHEHAIVAAPAAARAAPHGWVSRPGERFRLAH